jgi:glycogen(starch) synthase
MKIFYISAGAADIITAHRAWRSGTDDPSQMSITFSSQIAEFVEEANAQALFMSFGRDREHFVDERFTVEHRPFQPRNGARYYLAETQKAAAALFAAKKFGADVALVDSGALAWFALPMFQLAGIPIIPILHNVLWPAGFPPRGLKSKIKASINLPFWKQLKGPALGVSEESCRQVRMVCSQKSGSAFRFFPQFRREYFADIPLPPPRDGQFNVLFVGRAVEDKGLLLLPIIAQSVERRSPGAVRWTICGDGPDLSTLRQAVTSMGLDKIFDIRGWTTPAEIKVIYGAIHAVIVPTTSSFHEGFAMTAVEGVLAGRPLVTNSVVPALEDLRPASLSALPDDAESHADAVLALADDHALYERLKSSTQSLAVPFYDMKYGLKAALKLAINVPRFN